MRDPVAAGPRKRRRTRAGRARREGRPRGPDPRTRERRGAIPAKIFVGNLNYSTSKEELTELMSTAGTIKDVYLPKDRETGRPRGFAFVEFSNDEEAQQAIRKFDGQELSGRRLRVNIAEERGAPRRSAPPAPRFNDFEEEPRGSTFDDRSWRGSGKPKGSRRGLRGKKRSL